jgi:hypothetical protein
VSGELGWYLIIVVDDDGVFLARVSVNSDVNASNAEFVGLRGFAIPNTTHHLITKWEAAELIQSQFPGNAVSEPMAITNLRLDGDPYSHIFFFRNYPLTYNS